MTEWEEINLFKKKKHRFTERNEETPNNDPDTPSDPNNRVNPMKKKKK